jgi:hypothetical protein
MNTKIALTAIAIAAALALIVAPAMVETALAKKTEVCPSGNECQGASGAHNPNAECAAGRNLQTNANCPK